MCLWVQCLACAAGMLTMAARAEDRSTQEAASGGKWGAAWNYVHDGAAFLGRGLLRSLTPRADASDTWSWQSDNLCLPEAFVAFDVRGDLFPTRGQWRGLHVDAAQVRWVRGARFHVQGELEPYDGHALELEPGLTFAFQYRFR